MHMDFNSIDFMRITAHRIEEKQEGLEHAVAYPATHLLTTTQKSQEIIKDRLNRLMRTTNKAFECEIEDQSGHSFSGTVTYALSTLSDKSFIWASEQIAQNLAESMTHANQPGGTLLVIQAEHSATEPVWIAMMCNYDEAIRLDGMKENAEYLNDTLLSSDKKLYKAGIIYSKPEDAEGFPNEHFGALLLDPVFNIDNWKSKQFYESFLGFSLENNPEIQSKRFYDSTENFIANTYHDVNVRDDVLSDLDDLFADKEDEPDRTINPIQFAAETFQDADLMNSYVSDVANYLPDEIVPCTAMIENKLNKKKYHFLNRVCLSGPKKTFDLDIQVIDSAEQLEALEADHPNYTIVKILGGILQKP